MTLLARRWNSFNSPARLTRHKRGPHHICSSVEFINTKNRLKSNQDIFSQQSRTSDRLTNEEKVGFKQYLKLLAFWPYKTFLLEVTKIVLILLLRA